MRTIGRKWPEGIGPDRQAMCSYCGVQWRRSQLRRDASGNLACPDDAPGLDVVSLSEGNARLMRSQAPRSVGPDDGAYDRFVSPADPGFVDPNGPPAAPFMGGPTGELDVATNLWVRGDSAVVTPSTLNVATWQDMSGRQFDLTAVNFSEQPVLTSEDATLRGLPTIRGFGASKFMRNTTFKGGAPLWAWIIYKLNSHTPGGVILDAGVTLQEGTTPGGVQLVTNAGLSPENTSAAIGQWARAVIAFSTSFYDLLVIGSANGGVSGGQRFTSGFGLFGASGVSLSDVTIAEVLLTNGQPSATNVQGIETYGINRYGANLFA